MCQNLTKKSITATLDRKDGDKRIYKSSIFTEDSILNS